MLPKIVWRLCTMFTGLAVEKLRTEPSYVQFPYGVLIWSSRMWFSYEVLIWSSYVESNMKFLHRVLVCNSVLHTTKVQYAALRRRSMESVCTRHRVRTTLQDVPFDYIGPIGGIMVYIGSMAAHRYVRARGDAINTEADRRYLWLPISWQCAQCSP